MNAPIRHAWLFQYKDREPGSGRHDQDNDQSTPTDWPVQRWAAEMRPGDLVFLWQTTDKGGLRGWGEIARIDSPEEPVKGRTTTRVVVDERVWLGRPIPRSEVVRSGALEGNLLLRAPQGTTFRISPDEARNLAELLPERRQPSLEGLTEHRPVAPALPPQWWQGLLQRLGVSGASPAGELLLRLAAEPAPGLPGDISTTCLLLALYKLALEQQTEPGLQALHRLLSTDTQLAQGLDRLHQAYLAERSGEERGGSSIGATDNAWALLRRAVEIDQAWHGDGRLSADAVLAAVLRTGRGRLLGRLKEQGLELARMRAGLLAAINDPAQRQAWRQVWGEASPESSQAASSEPVAQAPPPPSPGQGVAQHGNDDPGAPGLDDALGAQDEAEAFARLIASCHLVPPMAVGVFGDWGSGKSFFLRLVHDHVKGLADDARRQVHADMFHAGIVQIRFNAWHYADTNLWASLVDHIFVELDQWARRQQQGAQAERLFDQLVTARELTLDAAEQLVHRRKEQGRAAQQLGAAEQKLEAARGRAGGAPQVYWSAVSAAFKEALGADPDAQRQLKRAAEILGLPQAGLDAEALSEAMQSLGQQAQRGQLVTAGVLRQAGGRWAPLLLLLGCLAVPAGLLLLRDGLSALLAWPGLAQLNSAVLTVSGALASVAGALGLMARRVHSAIDQVERFRGHLDTAVRKQVTAPAKEVKQAQDEFARLKAEVEEAKAQLAGSSERLAEAEREYASGTGRGRLMRFVRERAVNGDYAKHQGLVATVRKDFEQLAANMGSVEQDGAREAAQRKLFRQRIEALKREALLPAGPDGAPPRSLLTADELTKLDRSIQAVGSQDTPVFKRIVLYIDDLDRCAPDKVVDVLQAVHLLLGFPLFVVLVAVDVRWVSRALECHYPAMLGAPPSIPQAKAAASAHDYLEKIFQIPYWVRPMTPEASVEFLRKRSEAPQAEAGEADDLAAEDAAKEAIAPETMYVTAPREDEPGISPAVVNVAETARFDSEAEADTDLRKAAEIASSPAPVFSLDFSEAERDFIAKLAPFVGASPRRALRFLNVYRVMKSSLGDQDLALLMASQGHLALMTQVAVITGAPGLLREWAAALRQADDAAGLQGLRDTLAGLDWTTRPVDGANLMGALAALAAEPLPANHSLLQGLRRHADLAQRYSFTG